MWKNGSHLKQIVIEFGDDIFSTDGDILYCIMCDTKVAAGKRFMVQQHIDREKHTWGVKILNKKKSVKFYCNTVHLKVEISYWNFSEICVILWCPQIFYFGFWTMNNWKIFWSELSSFHPGWIHPQENYLSKCYNNILEMIRNEVYGKRIFVSIEETCDMEARYVVNIIETLKIDVPCEVFRLMSEVLEYVNHSIICKLFNRSMCLLWPKGIVTTWARKM
jgi:hypothetical protein